MARVDGVYTGEKDLEPVREFLRRKVAPEQASVAVPLVNFWNIFPVVVMMILVGEWVLRRRLNLI